MTHFSGRGDRDTFTAESLNAEALAWSAAWSADEEAVGAVVDAAQDLGAGELVIDHSAVLQELERVKATGIPAIPYLRANIEPTTPEAQFLNARDLSGKTATAGQVSVGAMLLGGVNNSSEEQGHYLNSAFQKSKSSHEAVTPLLKTISSGVKKAAGRKFDAELMTPLDCLLANATLEQITDRNLLHFAIYSYFTDREIGLPDKPFALFPQTETKEQASVFAYSTAEGEGEDREVGLDFMWGTVSRNEFTNGLGIRLAISSGKKVGTGTIEVPELAELVSKHPDAE